MTNSNNTIDALRNPYYWFEHKVIVTTYLYCNTQGYMESFYGRRCMGDEHCDGHQISKENGTLVGVSFNPNTNTAELFLRKEDKSAKMVKVAHFDGAQSRARYEYEVAWTGGWTTIVRSVA